MPYRRRGGRRGMVSYKPSGRLGKIGGALSIATKALGTAYAVKKLINVEYKSIRQTFTTDPSSSGAVVNLTAIAQGDGLANRDGNKVRAKMLQVRGVAEMNASATASHVRMVIVRDNNGSTTIPSISDLYPSVAFFASNSLKTNAPQSNSRFSVLWDHWLSLDFVGYGSTKSFAYSLPLDHHIFFSGTGATDEGKGHLYLFIASNEAINDPNIVAQSVVQFLDN